MDYVDHGDTPPAHETLDMQWGKARTSIPDVSLLEILLVVFVALRTLTQLIGEEMLDKLYGFCLTLVLIYIWIRTTSWQRR
jgi:hypothetical protein